MAGTFAWGAAADGPGVGGTWTAEIKMHAGKKAKTTADRIVDVRLNLKVEGDKATGTVVTSAKKKPVTAQIVDGKITGNQFSFTTVQTGKKGEQRMEWRGTVDGDKLQGTRSRAGAKRGQDFVAKRS